MLLARPAGAQTQFRLIVTNHGWGDGVVTSDPAGMSCPTAIPITNPGSCVTEFPAGTVVALTATPGAANTFGGWTGACTGTGTCQLTLNQDTQITANFVPTRYPVTIVGAGNGTALFFEPQGAGAGNPPLACSITRGQAGSTCTTQFPHGKTLRLGFQTNVGGLNVPKSFSSPPCLTSNPLDQCRGVVTGPTTIVIEVHAVEYQVRSGMAGGSGTVTATGGNTVVNCAISNAGATGACGEIFDTKATSPITFTATPAAGSTFTGWSGACSGTGPCTFMAAMPPNVPVAIANFAPAQTQARLTVSNIGYWTGVVTSNPAGIDCSATVPSLGRLCSAMFPTGTVVTLTAAAGTANTFGGWNGGGCTGTSTCQITLNQDTQVGATFIPTRYPVTIVGAGNGTASFFEPLGEGAGNPRLTCSIKRGQAASSCTTQFPHGQILRLSFQTIVVGVNIPTRISSPPCVTTDPFDSCRGVITGPQTIVIEVQSPEYQIKSGMAGGAGRVTTTVGNDVLDCAISNAGATGACGDIFDTKNPFLHTFSAVPDAGSTFVGWSGACSGAGTCSILPAMAPNVPVAIASFAPIQTQPTLHTVTIVNGGGRGAGRILAAASDAGVPRLDCQLSAGTATGTCSSQYPAGSVVHLDKTPSSAGSNAFATFSTPPCTQSTGNCSATVNAPITIAASFFAAEISVGGAGTGKGRVTAGSPANIDCVINAGAASGACVRYFDASPSAPVSFTATPDAGSRFFGWSGACSGTGACTFAGAMPPNPSTVVARFDAFVPTLTVSGTGSGSISSSPTGIACTIASGTSSGACSLAFDLASPVTLSATPASGWVFAGWGGACNGTGACAVTLSEDRSVTATFTRTTVILTLVGSGTGNGVVTAAPSATKCVITNGTAANTGCSVPVDQNASVTLTADPQIGSTFGGWEGAACTGTQPSCSLTLAQGASVTARFTAPRSANALAMVLLGTGTLTAAEQEQLDRFGNKDGKFNLGDLLALLDRTREKLSPSVTDALRSIPLAPAAPSNARRTP